MLNKIGQILKSLITLFPTTSSKAYGIIFALATIGFGWMYSTSLSSNNSKIIIAYASCFFIILILLFCSFLISKFSKLESTTKGQLINKLNQYKKYKIFYLKNKHLIRKIEDSNE